jgi:hypothetical protein
LGFMIQNQTGWRANFRAGENRPDGTGGPSGAPVFQPGSFSCAGNMQHCAPQHNFFSTGSIHPENRG